MTEMLTDNALDAELRAKYDADQLRTLGVEGKAYKNADGDYSYPIFDGDDLRKAIVVVGRGDASYDAIRAFTVTRAKALDQSDLIPDNWTVDGTLKESDSMWSTAEERETYMDLRQALETAISDTVPVPTDGAYRNVWVQDFADDWAVYEYKGDLYKVPYTRAEDGGIVVGNERTKVRPITEYVATRAEDQALELRKRAAEELTKGTVEHRTFSTQDVEIREEKDGTLHLEGYASVTENAYEVGPYQETIARGAFKRTLKSDPQPDVQLLINHSGLPLARTLNGTLNLREDRRGLKVEAELDPSRNDVKDLASAMKRGDIDQMSFAFVATDQEWSDDFSERTLLGVNIHRGDVSVVNQGANPATTSTLRSLESLRSAGPDALVAALKEIRSGRRVSSQSRDVLTQVLGLISEADDAVDEAQPLLADYLEVPNPDDDEAVEVETESAEADGSDGRGIAELLAEREAHQETPNIVDIARQQIQRFSFE